MEASLRDEGCLPLSAEELLSLVCPNKEQEIGIPVIFAFHHTITQSYQK